MICVSLAFVYLPHFHQLRKADVPQQQQHLHHVSVINMPDYKVILKGLGGNIGKGILSGVGGFILDAVLSQAGFGSGAEMKEVKESLQKLSTQMQELKRDIDGVKNAIQELGTQLSLQITAQLSNVLLDVKMTDLEGLISDLDTNFLQITSVVRYLADIGAGEKEANSPEKIRIQKVKDGRERLLQLLRTAIQDHPKALNRIHRALSRADENSILELSATRINDAEQDIITYYLRMSALIAPLWFAQTQAIGVLATAIQHPVLKFEFVDGPDLIATFNDNLVKQQETFRVVVGLELCHMVDTILGPVYTTIPVSFYYKDSRSVVVDAVNLHGRINGNKPFIACPIQSKPPLKYRLYPKFNCNIDQIKPSEPHNFQLFLEDAGLCGRFSLIDNYFFGNWKEGGKTLAYLDEGVTPSNVDFTINTPGDLGLKWLKREKSFVINFPHFGWKGELTAPPYQHKREYYSEPEPAPFIDQGGYSVEVSSYGDKPDINGFRFKAI